MFSEAIQGTQQLLLILNEIKNDQKVDLLKKCQKKQ